MFLNIFNKMKLNLGCSLHMLWRVRIRGRLEKTIKTTDWHTAFDVTRQRRVYLH